jgi:signal transduction histidine kinase
MNIARQVGTAAYAMQPTIDLQDFRQLIVTTREEERRRWQRDLHHGLGPILTSQTIKVGAARELIGDKS